MGAGHADLATFELGRAAQLERPLDAVLLRPAQRQVIGLFGGGAGHVFDPDGKSAFVLDRRKAGYYSFPVPPGQAGKLWKIQQASGAVRLLTVPPYLARSADELLLPTEAR